MNRMFKTLYRSVVAAVLCVVAAMGLNSCSLINDDLKPCPEGVVLRFVYDYNMEFANAFPAQVDCLTLLVYDNNGNFIKTITETTSVLSDENWRMTIDLPAGKTYRFVAYGGMACSDASFHFVNTPAADSKLQNLQVAMNDNCVDANPGVELHKLFYGALDLAVPAGSTDYTQGTVYMMRDTNTIRIMLQNVDGSPVDPADFNFEITANNTLMAYNNDLIPTADGNTYAPWVTGQSVVGSVDNGNEAAVAFAEFSVARLVENENVRLNITNAVQNDNVLSIPLIKYLILCKSNAHASMGDQEYLDRENHWNIILFMNNGRWIDTHIVVNDWIVRINDEEL